MKICVCGAGTMGSGIALAAAQAGFETILYEVNAQVLENAASSIQKTLGTLTSKGKISKEESDGVYQRINFTQELENCIADVIIEAIIEKKEAKIQLLSSLAAINTPATIFASNTSSLSIDALAKESEFPARVIGMHFFNPATLMKLVEVIRGEKTDEHVVDTIVNLARQMGKTPVLCKDSPGFIVNRVARPFYIETLRLAEEFGIQPAQADDILEANGFKMGPFKLMDLIGNDINYAVSCSVYEQMGNPDRLQPSYIQEEKIKLGKLGRKSGEGYYSYKE